MGEGVEVRWRDNIQPVTCGIAHKCEAKIGVGRALVLCPPRAGVIQEQVKAGDTGTPRTPPLRVL